MCVQNNLNGDYLKFKKTAPPSTIFQTFNALFRRQVFVCLTFLSIKPTIETGSLFGKCVKQPSCVITKSVHVSSSASHGLPVIQLEIELGRKKATSQTRAVEVIMPIVQCLAKLFVGCELAGSYTQVQDPNTIFPNSLPKQDIFYQLAYGL